MPASDSTRTTVLVQPERTPRRDRTAIATSIALHLCVLAALATLPRPTISGEDPDERVLLSSILHVQHRAPAHATAPAKPTAAKVAPQAAVERPVIHAAIAVEHSSRKLVVPTEARAASAPAPEVTQPPVPRPNAVAAAPVQVAAAAQPASTPTPVATPAPSPVAVQREEGIGNFGETYPAALEPSARAPLFGGVNGFVVRITVDENGRATSIEFVRAPSDPAQREELRTRLLATHFIPAACNGLRCAGTVELRN